MRVGEGMCACVHVHECVSVHAYIGVHPCARASAVKAEENVIRKAEIAGEIHA